MLLAENGVWVLDTEKDEWCQLILSDNTLYRPYMSATTQLNKGAIVYIGGSNSTKDGSVGVLNIERIIRRIEQAKEKDKSLTRLNLNIKEVWSPLTLSSHQLPLMHHRAVFLPDLESILVFGGV